MNAQSKKPVIKTSKNILSEVFYLTYFSIKRIIMKIFKSSLLKVQYDLIFKTTIRYRIRFNTTLGFYFSKWIFDPRIPHKNA